MKNHKLIEGSFSDEEAKDVLKNFFESKKGIARLTY